MMWDRMWDDHPLIMIPVTTFLTLALLVAVIAPTLAWLSRRTCTAQAEAMHREHRWGYFSGCLVSDGRGAFVPLDNYRDTRQEP